jgi:hypothetical protein
MRVRWAHGIECARLAVVIVPPPFGFDVGVDAVGDDLVRAARAINVPQPKSSEANTG